MSSLYDLISSVSCYAEDVRNVNLMSNVETTLGRFGDTIRLFHLKIPNTINLNHIETLNISNIWIIPFSLLRKLVKVTEYRNYYYVPIHTSLLLSDTNKLLHKFNDNYLPAISRHEISIIELKSSINFNYQLTLIYRHYEINIRRQLTQNNHNFAINDYHMDCIDNGVANIT